jgi:hypothetical protein
MFAISISFSLPLVCHQRFFFIKIQQEFGNNPRKARDIPAFIASATARGSYANNSSKEYHYSILSAYLISQGYLLLFSGCFQILPIEKKNCMNHLNN